MCIFESLHSYPNIYKLEVFCVSDYIFLMPQIFIINFINKKYCLGRRVRLLSTGLSNFCLSHPPHSMGFPVFPVSRNWDGDDSSYFLCRVPR